MAEEQSAMRAPPRPTGASTQGQHQHGRDSGGQELRPGMRDFLRIRANSVGSTRGAFVKKDKKSTSTSNSGNPIQTSFGSHSTPPISNLGAGGVDKSTPHKKKKTPGKSKTKPGTTPPDVGSGAAVVGAGTMKPMNLADVASMALSSLDQGLGLGGDPMSDKYLDAGPLGGQTIRDAFSPPQPAHSAQQQQQQHHTQQPPSASTQQRTWSGQQQLYQRQHHGAATRGVPAHPFTSPQQHELMTGVSSSSSVFDNLTANASPSTSHGGHVGDIAHSNSVQNGVQIWSPNAPGGIDGGGSRAFEGDVGQNYGSMTAVGRGGTTTSPQRQQRDPQGNHVQSMGENREYSVSQQAPPNIYEVPGVVQPSTYQPPVNGHFAPLADSTDQLDEIHKFSAIAQGEYNGYTTIEDTNEKTMLPSRADHAAMVWSFLATLWRRVKSGAIFPCHRREKTIELFDEFGNPLVGQDEQVGFLTYAVRSLLFDPHNPEFTSLQQFSWAVLLGVFMGILTAYWGMFIEGCVDVVWEKIPEILLEAGVFTELDGRFPLPHYMWICPAIFGGFLSYATAKLPVPIPGQNEWIESLHRQGVLDPTTFWYILVISTGGMASGLSLGPELPLVLLSGMVGSFLGKLTRQSVLSARVMNLTAAAAAIGGFFGFPMAGALFVLEIPHRMGLQYFEALSPATISSIVSVLVNRIVTGNDVKGYFNYPFLSATLPSQIFYIAVLYGLVGSLIGVLYAKGCIKVKTVTHDLFHHHDHPHDHNAHGADGDHDDISSEQLPLVGTGGSRPKTKRGRWISPLELWGKISRFGIRNEPLRATIVGTIAGIVTGVVCMFLPHSLFWGEAQLQTLIDNGKTRLPVFGEEGEPTADLTAYGYCLIEAEDGVSDVEREGFGIGCSALLVFSKIFVIGVSLGTGIVGGHFWGPLYVGAAGSNLFVGIMEKVHDMFGFGQNLYHHPCVALLCIMGSCHVVTFRAHTAIMLILTLTITAFNDGTGAEGNLGGDYSAVFPLLVVSCFVSLMVTRSTVFYKQQRCRGDIIAAPEVLCEPGKMGQPVYPTHNAADDSGTESYFDEDDPDGLLDTSWGNNSEAGAVSIDTVSDETGSHHSRPLKTVQSNVTPADIEREFASIQQSSGQVPPYSSLHGGDGSEMGDFSHTEKEKGRPDPIKSRDASISSLVVDNISEQQSTPPTVESSPASLDSGAPPRMPSSNIAELLKEPSEQSKQKKSKKKNNNHRRILSGSDVHVGQPKDENRLRTCSFDRGGDANSVGGNSAGSSGICHNRQLSFTGSRNRSNSRDRSNASTPTQAILQKVNSFGELGEFQPSLMNQARMRASSVVRNPTPPMVPKMGHRRKSSGSGSFLGSQIAGDVAGAISQEDIERAFSSVQNQANLESDSQLIGKAPNFVRRRVETDPHA